jgi:hypothetical protein
MTPRHDTVGPDEQGASLLDLARSAPGAVDVEGARASDDHCVQERNSEFIHSELPGRPCQPCEEGELPTTHDVKRGEPVAVLPHEPGVGNLGPGRLVGWA